MYHAYTRPMTPVTGVEISTDVNTAYNLVTQGGGGRVELGQGGIGGGGGGREGMGGKGGGRGVGNQLDTYKVHSSQLQSRQRQSGATGAGTPSQVERETELEVEEEVYELIPGDK